MDLWRACIIHCKRLTACYRKPKQSPKTTRMFTNKFLSTGLVIIALIANGYGFAWSLKTNSTLAIILSLVCFSSILCFIYFLQQYRKAMDEIDK